jgi:hypothetical protein
MLTATGIELAGMDGIDLDGERRCIPYINRQADLDQLEDCRLRTGTIYVRLHLGARPWPRAITAIHMPTSFAPTNAVKVILYLHGHTNGDPFNDIRDYWRDRDLRKIIDASGFPVILVAPTLTESSYSTVLAPSDSTPVGYPAWGYLHQVLKSLVEYGPYTGGVLPTIDTLILAAHSGGGEGMLKLARFFAQRFPGLNPECWGFDSLYGFSYGSVVDQWADWAAQGGRFVLHWSCVRKHALELDALVNKRGLSLAVQVWPKPQPPANPMAFQLSPVKHHDVPMRFLYERLIGSPNL